MGKLVSPKPKKNRLEEDGRQTAPRYERGQNFAFPREEGLCLARTHRRNFMKDAHALSFEVEFIRQISFLRHRPKVVAVSSGFAPYRRDQDRRSLQAILDCWLASL